MTRTKDSNKSNYETRPYGPKAERSYIQTATKAATHPVRSQILRSLRDAPRSTIDLEEITGEARYNLYHHLNLLESVGLVKWDMADSRTKTYSLREPRRPEVAVLILDENDIKNRPNEFKQLLDSVNAIERKEIPHADKIVKAELCFYYDWDRRDRDK
jgi:DNA-binding transcriptional ArsR family regulator